MSKVRGWSGSRFVGRALGFAVLPCVVLVSGCGGCSDAESDDGGPVDGGIGDGADGASLQDRSALDGGPSTMDGGPPADGGGADGGGADAGGADAGGGDAGDRDGGLDAGIPFDAGPLGCGDCHGDDTSPAPPSSVGGSVSTDERGVGAHRSHLIASPSWHREVLCQDCHVVPESVDDPGHTDTPLPAELSFGALARADGASPSFDGVRCSGVYCHGETLAPGGHSTQPEWTRVDGHHSSCGSCHGLPPEGGHPTRYDCASCHGEVIDSGLRFVSPERHVDGTVDVACGGCHDIPPDTGAHAVHASLAEPTYGGLGTAADLGSPAGYAFGCGYCHPRDPSRHMDGGPADIELYDPGAPADTFKARTPTADYVPGDTTHTDASGLPYTLGTCVDAPCHGGMSTSTGPVPEPGSAGFPFTGYPISYPAYTVDRVLEYVSVGWGESLGCGGCHGYPPRMDHTEGEAGAGESHSYIDASGYENLHMWNHGRAPIPCRTCHAATLVDVAAFSRDSSGVATLSDQPIEAFEKHVDGTVDIVFDTAHGVGSSGSTSLVGASWDPATSRCSDVACHLEQTEVLFGTPYRYGNGYECNVCHRY